MSYFRATAIQRRGLPLPGWHDIYGPDATSSAAAQAITLDLTPHLLPVPALSQELEQYFLSVSFGELKLDLSDPDGSLLAALGPGGVFDLSGGGYYGPWIRIDEVWDSGASSAPRFLGYVDETSIEWTEEDGGRLQCSAYPAIQAISARNLSDDTALKLPWPHVDSSASLGQFVASTAEKLMADYTTGLSPAYTPSSSAATTERALWASSVVSWQVWQQRNDDLYYPTSMPPPTGVKTTWATCPTPPTDTVSIGSYSYAVVDAEQGALSYSIASTVQGFAMTDTYCVAQLRLSPLNGAPADLYAAGLRTDGSGAPVIWGAQAQARRSHFKLVSAVPAPASGADGQDWMLLDSVDTLAPGHTLRIVLTDASTSKPRRSNTDVVVRDVDPERNCVYLTQPLSSGLDPGKVVRIRRVEQDPVYWDALSVAARVVSPLSLDTSAWAQATTTRPILQWLPGSPVDGVSTYGIHHVSVLVPATTAAGGTFQAVRRGWSNTNQSYTGSPSAGWTALSNQPNYTPLAILADVCQFPGGTNAHKPPLLYVENDISGSSPVNGWRCAWRSYTNLDTTTAPTLPSTWNGTTITWGDYTPTTWSETPAKLVAYCATSGAGRYTRTSSGAGTFEAHTTDSAWGASTSFAFPASSATWLALGWVPLQSLSSGVYTDVERLMGLVQDSSGYHAILIDQTSGSQIDATADYLLCSLSDAYATKSSWTIAAGLVLKTWLATVDGYSYPCTRLALPNHLSPGTFDTLDLLGFELLPGAICARSLVALDSTHTRVGGWFALALETYADDSGNVSRRYRFLQIGWAQGSNGKWSLTVQNGNLEANLSAPELSERKGDILMDPAPSTGGLIAEMRRTGYGDQCVGVLGSRMFQTGFRLPAVIERIKVSDMTGQDALEALGAALMATVVPRGDGSVALVSRQGGTLRVRRSQASHNSTPWVYSWTADEVLENPSQTPVSRAYISEVDITYEDVLSGSTAKVVVDSVTAGGKPLDKDLSKIITTAPTARAIGTAIADVFSPIAPGLKRTLREDIPGGVQAALPPPFWASWQVGDRVIDGTTTAGSTVYTYKLTRIEPDFDARTCAIEAIRLPSPEVIS